MLEPTYRQALSHAWHLVWRDKILWIFGLLSIFIGQFGLSNFIGQLIFLSDTSAIRAPYGWWLGSWSLFRVSGATQVVGIVWLALVVLVLGVALILLAVAAQGGLIDAAAQGFKNRTRPTMMKAWQKGVKHFWRLLVLNVAQRLLLGIILVAAVFFLINISPDRALGFLATVLALMAGALLALGVSAVAAYAAGFIVEDERTFFGAIGAGWKLFDRHLLVSLELSIILLGLNWALVAVIFLGSFVVLLPAVLIWLLAGATGLIGLAAAGLGLALSLFILLVVVAGAIFNAFTTCAWMYLFMKMRREGMASRLLHYARKMVGK